MTAVRQEQEKLTVSVDSCIHAFIPVSICVQMMKSKTDEEDYWNSSKFKAFTFDDEDDEFSRVITSLYSSGASVTVRRSGVVSFLS